MKKFIVKITFPTALEFDNNTYYLFTNKEIELPDNEIIQTYLQLGYLQEIEEKKKKIEVKN
ncbi:MAG: hypothetical protein NZZ41_03305 [Candidatus Dojkabacteria bacterium]|nr:hypothetical protein [Candidatus Dojkabacteria bacterium]